jgi:hypothetical protein
MSIEESYHFIGYEGGTNSEVLNWPSVVPTRRFHRGDVIVDDVRPAIFQFGDDGATIG